MSTTNPETPAYPFELSLAPGGASRRSSTFTRVDRVEVTAADQAIVTLGTGVILLIQILTDVDKQERVFVNVTVREDDRETPLLDSAGQVIPVGDSWPAFVFTAIVRYDAHVELQERISLEGAISTLISGVLHRMRGEGVLDVRVSAVSVTLIDGATLARAYITVSDECDARNELVIRHYLYELLRSTYDISVRHESQIEITYDPQPSS